MNVLIYLGIGLLVVVVLWPIAAIIWNAIKIEGTTVSMCNACYKHYRHSTLMMDYSLCPICEDMRNERIKKAEMEINMEADEHEEQCKQYFKNKKLNELQKLIDVTESELRRLREAKEVRMKEEGPLCQTKGYSVHTS